jgi:Domain of unknown function (DUF4386)
MRDEEQRTRERTILRIGAVCAILGAIVSVAAGMSFGNLTNEYGTEQVLRTIAARPEWYWPTVHLGFIVGAFFWVGAFIALAISLQRSVSWALGWLGAATVIVGAAIHVVDSSISGFGLAALASAWASAPAPEQSNLLRIGDTLLYALNGTWRSVHSYFHGVPFILSGMAVAFSRRYPPWIGWLGVVGGAGSFLGGVLQFLDFIPGSERLVIVPAQVVSLWMVVMGVLMWRRAGAAGTDPPSPSSPPPAAE